ncbi:Ig-like domain-containing domain [Adhaeribacter aquaticus]|uniref:Ig-like domain-containing domain n=1 Tax=Adhaeribacter aquaticus TaxID=299567 RepID=UPI000424000B|nr:Ig-like domain-containing domain [Adhaeribacter aquaticus]
MFKSNSLYLLLLSVFFYACASVGSPEGGPKDTVGPELISSNPLNRAINVSTKTLELNFNEEIRLKDFTREILITPNTTNTYKTTVKKDRLIIDFEKPFLPNTTYYLNLRGGVEDVTEGNKVKNPTLTFSTGAYIDSGSVKGTVKDLFTNAPEKSINVVLYAAKDTTTIRKHRPYYFTQTDEQGNFALPNLKFGEYRILAHQDKNNNMIFDNEAEKIAYLPGFVNITAKTDPVNLLTLRVDSRKPIIESTQKFIDEFRIVYNEGITAVKVAPVSAPASNAPFFPFIDTKGRSNNIVLYPTDLNITKSNFLVSVTDSAGNTKTDTVNVSLEGKKATRPKPSYSVKTRNGQLTKEDPLQIEFVVPVKIAQPQAALTIVEDSVSRKTLNYPQDFTLNTTATVATVKQPLIANKTLQVILDTTKVVPISGDRFTRQTNKVQMTNKVQVGTLIAKINTTHKKYWVELMDNSFKVVQVFDTPKALNLNKLEPSTYRIRIKIDENNNGKWEAGDPELVAPAERIFHFPDQIEIRANWEIEIALTF